MFKKWAVLVVLSVMVFVSGVTYAAPVITHADSYTAAWVTALTDPHDLLQTSLASTATTGNFNVWNWCPLGAAVLKDGQFFTWPTQFSTWTNNAAVEYYLNTSVNTYGYTITGINTYGGWNDGGRDAQQYSIYYRVVGSADWILYDSVDYNPANPVSPSLSRLAWSVNLQNVDAIKLAAPASVENGSVGLCEIDVIGTPTSAPTTVVHAGADQAVWLNGGIIDVSLNGTVTSSVPYTVLWSVASQPAGSTVVFTPAAANTEDLSVRLDRAGTYVLRLTADDGSFALPATTTVTVYAGACAYAQAQPGFVWILGDINYDCEVNIEDLMLLAEHWLGGDSENYIGVNPSSLRCEYKVDPLGIDVQNPRLSWKVIDPDHIRGQEQTSYQILVASSLENLNRNYGDLWNSGRVNSGQSVNIAYAGNPLTSGQACYWAVRIWDKDGTVSPYCSPAKWSMGLLNTSTDWDGAKWISYPLPAINYSTTEQQGEGTSYSSNWTHAETISFSNVTGSSMTFAFTGSFVQWIGTRDANRGIAEVYFDGVKEQDVDCYSAATQSGQVLFTKQFNIWPGLHTMTIKVKGQKNATSSDFIIDVDSFKYSLASPFLPPASYWRKDFSVPAGKTMKRAMVYVTALGDYELRINGCRVGEDYFNPGWTQFTTRMNPEARNRPHRVYYHTYDVTSMLSGGNNAIGTILSTGWYAGYIWAGTFNYGEIPEFMAKLKIEYSDGTSEAIVSDGNWKHTYNGPIREGDIQQGETYDARLEMNGWDRYGYDETGWLSPQIVIDAGNNNKYGAVIKVQSHPAQPVRKTASREPSAVTDVGGGKYVVKFDQQMSGWIEFRGANGAAGNQIKLQYSSAINPDGTIYTTHLRDMRGQDFYIMKGTGNEGWEPRFTYHGFQYVEITGWPGIPAASNFTAHIVHTDAPLVHTFESSDPRINKLDKMVEMSIRTNTIDIPAACADRAERLGWMGDRNCFLETEPYYLDTSSFLTKWMQDIVDAQAIGVSGTFHQVCPIWGDIESSGWSEAGMNLPYVMLKFYGDTALSNKHYSSLHEYASYIDGVLDSADLRTTRMYHPNPSEVFIGYGDWLAIDQDREADAPRFNTIQNYASITRMAEIAVATGRSSDASYFGALATSMKNSFNNAWVNSDGVIVGESQTLYATAFDNDLIKDGHASVEQVKNQFVNEILNKSHVQTFADALGGYPTIPAGHLTTGFGGSNALLPSLSDCGRNDVAYSLLLKDTFPSWLYCINNGMTTGWERWDSYTPDKGFQSPAMNSFNLPAMHASIGQWLMGYAAGIKPDGYGFKKIQIKPYIGHGLDYIDASYDSPYGMISIRWEKNSDGSLDMDVVIPASTTATVCVPNYSQISESGNTVWQNGTYYSNAVGIAGAALEGDFIRFNVSSGSYSFKASGQEAAVDHAAAGVTYSGSGWNHYPSLSYTRTTNSTVSYTFNGTGIKWMDEKAYNRGFVDVFIDGVQVTTIDAYSPTIIQNQVLFSKIGLSSGQHIITLKCKGQKHPSSSDYYIGLMRFKVMGN
jgi:hypothetical protein